MGIAIDFLVGLFLIWSLWRGWRHGFLYQLGQIAAAVVCYFAARGLGELLRDPIASLGVAPDLAATVGFIVAFVGLYLIASIVIRKLAHDLTSVSEGLTSTDRALGLIVGGIKGVFIAYVAIVSMVMVDRFTGKLPIPFASSVAGRLAITHNFFDTDERLRALTKLAWVVSTHEHDEIAANPHIRAVMEHPKAADLMTPEVIQAAGDRDVVTLLSTSEVWDFLDDPEIQALLDEIEGPPAEELDDPVDVPTTQEDAGEAPRDVP